VDEALAFSAICAATPGFTMWYPPRKLPTMALLYLLQDGISGAIALPPPQARAVIQDEVGAFHRTMKKTALQSKIGPRLADCYRMYLLKIILRVLPFSILLLILICLHAFIL